MTKKKSLTWWFENLDNVKKSGDGWTSECPAHDDQSRDSLHINETEDGEALVHCFASCTYQEILEALEGTPVIPPSIVKIKGVDEKPTEKKSPVAIKYVDTETGEEKDPPKTQSPSEWFEGYVNVPWDEISEMGVRVNGKYIEFTFESTETVVRRQVGKHSFIQHPTKDKGGKLPPFWPSFSTEKLDGELWIVEGLTDAIVTRHVGLPAYSLTGGAEKVLTHLSMVIQNELHRRGVRKIYICLHADSGGIKATEKLVNTKEPSLVQIIPVDIAPVLKVIDLEKDILDLWRRLDGDKDQLFKLLKERSDAALVPNLDLGLVTIEEILATDYPPQVWLVEDWAPLGELGLIASDTKVGKSVMELMKAVEVGRGGMFLGRKCHQGNVLYISLEGGSGRQVKERLQKMGYGPSPKNVTFMFMNQYTYLIGDLASSQGVEALWKLIVDNDFAFVIIDTLEKASAGDPDSSYDMKKVFVPLYALCQKTGCSIEIVDHMRKWHITGNFIKNVGGSRTKGTVSDYIWAPSRKVDKETQRLLPEGQMNIAGRNIPDSFVPLLFDEVAVLWKLPAADMELTIHKIDSKSKYDNQILEAMQAGPEIGMTNGEIATALGLSGGSTGTISARLEVLMKTGFVNQTISGRGVKYRLRHRV